MDSIEIKVHFIENYVIKSMLLNVSWRAKPQPSVGVAKSDIKGFAQSRRRTILKMKARFLITGVKCSIAHVGDNLPPGCSGDLWGPTSPCTGHPRGTGACQVRIKGLQLGPCHLLKE